MRERQQATIRRNAQYYKPLVNQFKVGQWVWIFDPRIIPGSCDKLRSYWAGPYQIMRLLAPALAKVMAVFEQGKPRVVSLDILKEYRGENNVHGFPSDPPPPHPSFQGEEEVKEIPTLTQREQRQERQGAEHSQFTVDNSLNRDCDKEGRADRETQICVNNPAEMGQADQELDMDEDTEMQGGEGGAAPHLPTPSQKNIEEPPQTAQRHTWRGENKAACVTPPPSTDNKVIMEEAKGGGEEGARRAQGRQTHWQMAEARGDKEESLGLAPHQLPEYETSWDEPDQSKKMPEIYKLPIVEL